MFWPDVIDLKHFYATPAGELVLASLRSQVRKLWPSLKGETVLGVGFCPPLLQSWLGTADSAWACMPAQQGVIHWPATDKNRTFLADETELPFADNSVSRVVLLHALENTEQVRQMVKEVWRVLTPTGRVLVIAPNRMGIWARSKRSPFAHGHPYTAQQLHELLLDHSLTPLKSRTALFFWPARTAFMLKIARFTETVGSIFSPGLGGIILMEAEKQIYAPTSGLRSPVTAKRRTIPSPAPVPKPVMGNTLPLPRLRGRPGGGI